MRSETACIALLGTAIFGVVKVKKYREAKEKENTFLEEVLLIRRIRELLYEQGFTISGARNKLNERGARNVIVAETVPEVESGVMTPPIDIESIRSELEEIRSLLTIVKKE